MPGTFTVLRDQHKLKKSQNIDRFGFGRLVTASASLMVDLGVRSGGQGQQGRGNVSEACRSR